MRILFAGTPGFASLALERLLRAGLHIVAVLTQPDRPSGRGLKTHASAVKEVAVANGIPVLQPTTLKDQGIQGALRALQPDVMIVAAYGLILPQAVLDIPRFGGINIHASLLPRWRGAAPIQRALLAGDPCTGVTIMQMAAGLDSGPILTQAQVPIATDDTAGTLHDKLAELGANEVLAVVLELQAGKLPPSQPQREEEVTYAAKIAAPEALIDWNQSAVSIERKIRAFSPHPGASTAYAGTIWKLWRAEIVSETGHPGQVLDSTKDRLVVACGQNALRIMELQSAGGKKLNASAFLAGRAVRVGDCLGEVGQPA